MGEGRNKKRIGLFPENLKPWKMEKNNWIFLKIRKKFDFKHILKSKCVSKRLTCKITVEQKIYQFFGKVH